MTATCIDKALLKQIDVDALAALRPLLKIYGLDIAPAGGSFTATEAVVKFRIRLAEGSEAAVAAAKKQFDENCHFYGLKPEDFGKTFKDGKGRPYKITGLCPERPKMVVKAVSADGKNYLFPAAGVIRALQNGAGAKTA